MPPPTEIRIKENTSLHRSVLFSAIFLALCTLSASAQATYREGITISGHDEVINVEDSVFNLGPGLGAIEYPITFKSNHKLTINFTGEEGTVNINQHGTIMDDGGINVQDNSRGNLEIINGSLNVSMDTSAYQNQGLITFAFGGSIYIEKDLTISCSTQVVDNLKTDHPYAALLLADSFPVDIGGNIDVSLRTQFGENSRYPSVLVGIWNDLRSDGLEDNPSEWNLGSKGGALIVHDIIANSGANLTEAYGIRIDSDNTHVTVHNGAEIRNIHAFTKSVNHPAYAVGTEVSGGVVDFLGSVTIKNISAQSSVTESDQPWIDLPTGTVSDTDEAYALAAYSGGTINITPSSATDIVQIENDMIVSEGSTINANFLNESSRFVGVVHDYNGSSGTVKLNFTNGAYWLTTASNTQAVDLSLNNATVYLNQTVDGQTKELAQDNTVALTLSKLSGENGVFYMSTSVEGAYGDSIKIEEGSGKHQLLLSSSGAEPTEDALNRALVTETNGSMELSLANEGGQVDLGNYVYDLATRQTDSGTEWYLSDNSSNPEPDPDPTPDPDPDPTPTPEPQPELSPSATAVLALAGSGSQTTQFLYSLSDLRKRMGDIRYGAADGLYASQALPLHPTKLISVR